MYYKEVEFNELSDEEKACPESTEMAAYKCLKTMVEKTGQPQSPQDLPKIMNKWGWKNSKGNEYVVNAVAPLFAKTTGKLYNEGYVKVHGEGENRDGDTCTLWVANSSVAPPENRVPNRLSAILSLDKEYPFFSEEEKKHFENRRKLVKNSPKFTETELLKDARALQPDGIFGYSPAEAGGTNELGERSGGDFGYKGGVLVYYHALDDSLLTEKHRGDGFFFPEEANYANGSWDRNSDTISIVLISKEKTGSKCKGTFKVSARKHKHIDGREFTVLADENTVDLIEANLKCREILTKRLSEIQDAFCKSTKKGVELKSNETPEKEVIKTT